MGPSGFTSGQPSLMMPIQVLDPLLGKVVGGRYKILSQLGAGGMGTVYEAEHMGLSRPVALKVLNPLQAKKKNTVQRFQQEARAAGGIGHPNICEVYDMGWLDDGCPYLVMEKLNGETLAERVRVAGGLPFAETVAVLGQVLSGLMAAHEKGIMHRDIKPENIFLAQRSGSESVVKILDFGVSKAVAGGIEEPLDLTRTGMVMGTPYYMSPEQARGERNLDARVDVYACGVMLYECITGRRPFLAPNYNALLLQILTESPRSVRERRRDCPQAFEALIARAMARSRDQRYPTAAAMKRDLVQLAKQLGASSEPAIPTRLPVEPQTEVARPALRAEPSPLPPRVESHPDPWADDPWADDPWADPRPEPISPRPVAPRPAAGAPPRPSPPGRAPLPSTPPPAPPPAFQGPPPSSRTPSVAPPLMPQPHAPSAPGYSVPLPPSTEEKRRAPVAGLGRGRPPATDHLPWLGETGEASVPMPIQKIRQTLQADGSAGAPPPSSRSRPSTTDFSEAPTAIVSREQLFRSPLPSSSLLRPVSPDDPLLRPIAPGEWDSEATVTSGPPMWDEEDTHDDTQQPPSIEERSIHKISDLSDIPLDSDKTLIHRPKPPRPRR